MLAIISSSNLIAWRTVVVVVQNRPIKQGEKSNVDVYAQQDTVPPGPLIIPILLRYLCKFSQLPWRFQRQTSHRELGNRKKVKLMDASAFCCGFLRRAHPGRNYYRGRGAGRSARA